VKLQKYFYFESTLPFSLFLCFGNGGNEGLV
jgi:hypothetical protein